MNGKNRVLLAALLVMTSFLPCSGASPFCENEVAIGKSAQALRAGGGKAAVDGASLPARLPLVLVLCYHDIATSAATLKSEYDITRADFEAQLDWLESNGYESISTEELYKALQEGGQGLPRKPFVLTFDDGYLGNRVFALPILRKRGLKGDFFVHVDYVGKAGKMTWEELQAADRDPLFAVYPHTRSHPRLSKLDTKQLEKEVSQSRAIVECRLGGKRPFFAFPFGDYDRDVMKESATTYGLSYALGGFGTFGPMNYPRLIIEKNRRNLRVFALEVKAWHLRYGRLGGR